MHTAYQTEPPIYTHKEAIIAAGLPKAHASVGRQAGGTTECFYIRVFQDFNKVSGTSTEY